MSLARARPSRRSQAAKAAPSSWQGKARPTRQVSSLALRSGARTHPSLFVQAKLEVNQPGDPYERQADAVAGRVMRMALSPGEEPREDLALAQNPRALQRAPASPSTPSVSASTASAIRNPGAGQALSPGVRSRIEPHLGASLGNVRVHSGPAANQAAASLQARAFTHQNHIFLRSSAQSGNLGLMAHEAAHVVQQGAAPVQRAPADAQEPPEVQRSLVDDLVEGAGAVADTVSGALVDAAGAVVDMGADFFWSTLETIAPGFAPILRQIQQEGILGYLGGLLRGALGRVFDSLTGEPGAFDQLVGVFSQLAGQVGGILTALLSGDCQPLLDAVGQLKAMLEQIGSDVWNGITDFFRPIGEFFSGLWQQFGAPVVDWLKATGGEVWQEIQDLGGEIWAWTQPFRDDLAAGWDWVKEQLFGSAEGGEADSAESSGGLVGWITDKAGQAWGAIQAELEPAIAPIQSFADSVVAFLPMAQILSLRETVTGFLGDATSLTERLGQPQDVVENQDTLRDEILPGVLTTIVSVREGLVTAGGWLSAQIGLIAQTVTGMIDSLRSNGILGAVAGAIGWVQEAVGRIYAWQQTAVVALFTGIAEGLGYLSQFIEPVFNALQQVVTVLGDLVGQIGGFITGIWTRIPACIREPLMKFLTEQIFSRIPLFDQFMKVPDLFARVAQTALTILRKVFVDGDLLGALWTYFSALLELLGLPPDLILRIITKAATAFSDIINDPIGFFINLLKAVKQGFVQFFDNIFKHLLSGVTNWLFGQLAEAGISPPADLSLGSIIQFILDVLGLTIDNLFERLGNKIGREKAERIRAAFALATGAIRWIYRLVTEGPGALWEELKGQLSNLVTLVLDSVVSWMTKVIIARATVYLLGLMDPTFIMSVVNSLIAIYNVIETFVRYMRQILETVESVLDGIGGIARGALGQAAGFVEASLVRSLPIVIAFLASLLGLGGLGRRIGEMVESVRGYVNQAIDWLIDKGLALFNALLEGGKAVAGKVAGWLGLSKKFTSKAGHEHTLSLKTEGKNAVPMMASTIPDSVRKRLDTHKTLQGPSDELSAAYTALNNLDAYIDSVTSTSTTPQTSEASISARIQELLDILAGRLAALNLDTSPALSKITYATEANPLAGTSSATAIIGFRAKTVVADPLTKLAGNTKGSQATSSQVIGYLVTPEDQRGTYVRAHLINYDYHGPGDQAWNLVQFSQSVNSQMSSGIEQQIKKWLFDENRQIKLTVTVDYWQPGAAASTRLGDDVVAFGKKITISWEAIDGTHNFATGHSATGSEPFTETVVPDFDPGALSEFRRMNSAKAFGLYFGDTSLYQATMAIKRKPSLSWEEVLNQIVLRKGIAGWFSIPAIIVRVSDMSVTVDGILLDSGTRQEFENRAEAAFKQKYEQMKLDIIDGKSRIIKANTGFWTRSLGEFTYGELKGFAKVSADGFPEWPGE